MIINLGYRDYKDPMAKPVYTYTGNSQFIDKGSGNWEIKFLTSGTINFKELNSASTLDVFCVGGGGGGTQRRSSVGDYGVGGGGGYTTTKKGIQVKANTNYSIQVGAGGVAKSNSSSGNPGQPSTAFGVTGAGGGGQTTPSRGANGGSGSGGNRTSDHGGYFWNSGGEDGSDGASGNRIKNPGIGQHTTTRAFGESAREAYSRGGPTTSGEVYNRDPNTGDGGYGGQTKATNGGSGIVIIRNHVRFNQKKIFDFTYSTPNGYTMVKDDLGNFTIQFLKSGTLTVSNVNDIPFIDIFAVGGGGGGGRGDHNHGGKSCRGGGGRGGQCVTKYKQPLEAKAYTITVGNGGSVSASNKQYDGNPGSPSSFGALVTAQGGPKGLAAENIEGYDGAVSGGSRTPFSSTTDPGNAYAKKGSYRTGTGAGAAGAANTGNGGQGGGWGNNSEWNGGSGGSGIIIIRNAK